MVVAALGHVAGVFPEGQCHEEIKGHAILSHVADFVPAQPLLGYPVRVEELDACVVLLELLKGVSKRPAIQGCLEDSSCLGFGSHRRLRAGVCWCLGCLLPGSSSRFRRWVVVATCQDEAERDNNDADKANGHGCLQCMRLGSTAQFATHPHQMPRALSKKPSTMPSTT